MIQDRLDISGVSFFQVNGAWIAEDTILGNNVTILPGSVLGRPPVSTNALARQSSSALPPLSVGDNCVLGVNVVLYRGTTIGKDCLLGDTACVREQVSVGDQCVIAMGVTINYNTTIGSRVKVMDNSHLTGNMVIEDDVFIAELVCTANDNSMGREVAFGVPPEKRLRKGPIIRRFATIGQGACLQPNIEIGENTIVASNAVVTKSMPPLVLAMGIPARIVRSLRESEIRK